MTHEEEREYLIEVLLTEMPQYRHMDIPGDEEARWRLLRSLFNLRPPMPAGLDFLSVQDKYLSEEVRRRGVVDSRFLKNVGKDRRVFLWQGDITRLKADAIVNAANSGLLGCFHPCPSVSRFLEHDSSLRQVIFNVFTDTDRELYRRIVWDGHHPSE